MLTLACYQGITAVQAKALYPNVTDDHLALLKKYPEGYPEAVVEWVSLRVKSGLGFGSGTEVTLEGKQPDSPVSG